MKAELVLFLKKETGKTLIQYLTELRIENAKKLLKNTELKVYEIAEAVGYSNSQYLSNLFYKEVGCFPVGIQKKWKVMQRDERIKIAEKNHKACAARFIYLFCLFSLVLSYFLVISLL